MLLNSTRVKSSRFVLIGSPSFLSALQSSSGQLDEDEITWGSDELPIENINSKFTGGQSADETTLEDCFLIVLHYEWVVKILFIDLVCLIVNVIDVILSLFLRWTHCH